MSQTEQTQPRRKSPRLLWLVLATIAIFVSVGALTLWLPYHDRQTIRAEFEQRGAIVTTRQGGPDWLRADLDFELAMFEEVVAADFVKSKVADDDIELLLKFPKLQALTLYGPELTDASLLHLQTLSQLHSLMLINCPKLSQQALADFRTARPDVGVVRRGNALLGIAGETVPAGCHILMVAPGLGAQNAGLNPGDIITKLDDEPVTGYDSLTELLLTRQPGEKVKLTVRTERETSTPSLFEEAVRTVEVTLSAWQQRLGTP